MRNKDETKSGNERGNKKDRGKWNGKMNRFREARYMTHRQTNERTGGQTDKENCRGRY